MEPEVSERGLGCSQNTIQGRSAELTGVLVQVDNHASPKGRGMLCHVKAGVEPCLLEMILVHFLVEHWTE